MRLKRHPGQAKRLTSASTCVPSGSLRRADERNLHRHADHIFDLNLIARFDVAADGFRADPGVVDLAIRVIEVRKEHVPGHLAVDAHRLDPLQYSVPSTLQHLTYPPGRMQDWTTRCPQALR